MSLVNCYIQFNIQKLKIICFKTIDIFCIGRKKRKKQLLLSAIEKSNNVKIGGKFNEEKEEWISTFYTILKENNYSKLKHIENVFEGFFDNPIEQIKVADTVNDFSSAIIICTIKDNIVYLNEMLPYYRKLGIKHFVFIDNGSIDGSIDYLMKQKDVSMFKSPHKYNGETKNGWNLQAIAKLGLNHWYLLIDSDEFLAYHQMEKFNIKDLIKKLEEKKYSSIHGFMLDMYPQYPLIDGKHKNLDFFKDYKYFDGMNKYYSKSYHYIWGGLRGRIIDAGSLRLDKYSLAYCCKNHIFFGNHDICGKNKKSLSYGYVLKHYKFLPEDKDKYIKTSKSSSGYSQKNMIKKYMKLVDCEINAFNINSIEWIDSSVLNKFPFILDLFKD